MPQSAAIGIGMGASAIGGVLSSNAAAPKLKDSPPPNPLFPWLNQSYGSQLQTAGPQGINTLQQFAQDGKPSNFGDVFSTLVDSQQRMLGQGRAGLREQFGASGTRYSTGFANAAVDYEAQSGKDFANILAQLALSTSESSAQRQLSAASQLSGMFGEAATSYTPSKYLQTGGTSTVGSAFSQGGKVLSTLGLLQSMGIIGGSNNGGVQSFST